MYNTRIGTLLRCSQLADRASDNTLAQQRLFATSAALLKHGGIPPFTDVSSDELQYLLAEIREKLLLPSRLSSTQRSLTQRARYRPRLEAEPVIATIGEEEFVLKPLPLSQRPKPMGTLRQATMLMREKKDWDNLPNLLQGLKTAQSYLKISDKNWNSGLEDAIGNMGNAGRQDVLLECLRRGSETGMTMNTLPIAQRVFKCFHRKAYDNDFSAVDTKKALSWAEQALALMENPEHTAKPSLTKEDDPRAAPEVAAILLSLAAVRVSKHLEGKDTENKVSSYTEKLLNTQVAWMPIPDKQKVKDNVKQLNSWMLSQVPILYGMNLALTLQPGNDQLRSRVYALSEQVLECKRRLEEAAATRGIERSLHGHTLYDKLIGTGSL